MRIIIINSFALVGSEAEDGDDQQAGKRAATSRKRTKRTSHLANPYRFKCDQVLS